jgi:hypothetical protein
MYFDTTISEAGLAAARVHFEVEPGDRGGLHSPPTDPYTYLTKVIDLASREDVLDSLTENVLDALVEVAREQARARDVALFEDRAECFGFWED